MAWCSGVLLPIVGSQMAGDRPGRNMVHVVDLIAGRHSGKGHQAHSVVDIPLAVRQCVPDTRSRTIRWAEANRIASIKPMDLHIGKKYPCHIVDVRHVRRPTRWGITGDFGEAAVSGLGCCRPRGSMPSERWLRPAHIYERHEKVHKRDHSNASPRGRFRSNKLHDQEARPVRQNQDSPDAVSLRRRLSQGLVRGLRCSAR